MTLAIALAKLAPHLEVDIYEAAQGYSFVGAGIGMWPRTWDVLQKLGLSEALHSRVDYSCAGDVTFWPTLHYISMVL